jgi:FkbM family methyltransferase
MAEPDNNTDIVEINIGTGRACSFKMLRHAGKDQIATTVGSGGWQSWERPMPEYFFAHATRCNGLILDVGTNTGFYALLAATASRRNKVIGFEPDPNVRMRLAQNLAINTLGQQISVHSLALSNRSGVASLYIPDPGHGLIETSSSLEPGFKETCSAIIEVPTATLDEFLAFSGLLNTPVTMIKIDVEGHEYPILDGAVATIARWRPIIFVEVLQAADFAGLSRFLADHSYVDIPLVVDGALEQRAQITFAPDAWNHALAPKEQFARFKALWK